ncbi:MAG: hypothetical protein M1339_03395 [Bacteroidetes bacterium]|nr:hypothetical protein [Bacteroidota bacterium]
MNPQDLIGPASPLGNPAPFWFITFFKVLGFILHMIPMNIWYAGMLITAIFAAFGRNYSRELAHRMSRTMPIIVALGINLGIVPLLFTQVGYYQFYYPAGVLMAHAWFSVIIILVFAYYGVYVYSLSARSSKSTRFAMASAWISSVAFIFIGFLFANNFSLMVNVHEWIRIFDRTNAAGAVTGTALNMSDPTLIPRWLMMFGLAVTTTAVFIAFDAVFFKRKDTSDDYRKWAGKFAFFLYSAGLVFFAAMGSWYIFGALEKSTLDELAKYPLAYFVFGLTAVSPGFVFVVLFTQRKGLKKKAIILASILQVAVLSLNAISRQWVQNVEIFRYQDVSRLPVSIQWSPMIVFLVLFVIGLAVVGWMAAKIAAVEKDAVRDP